MNCAVQFGKFGKGIFIILILIESYFTFIDIIHHFGLDEVSFHVYPEK